VPQFKTKNLNAAVLKDMICYEKVLFLLCFIYLTCPYGKNLQYPQHMSSQQLQQALTMVFIPLRAEEMPFQSAF
jgi:hypothetical protein